MSWPKLVASLGLNHNCAHQVGAEDATVLLFRVTSHCRSYGRTVLPQVVARRNIDLASLVSIGDFYISGK